MAGRVESGVLGAIRVLDVGAGFKGGWKFLAMWHLAAEGTSALYMFVMSGRVVAMFVTIFEYT